MWRLNSIFGCYCTVPSSPSTESENSSPDPEMQLEMGFASDSYTDTPLESLQTDEVVDYAADMMRSPRTNENDRPVDICQNSGTVSEWVDQQSLPIPAPKLVVSVPTPDSKPEPAQSSSASSLQPKVYGIPTLLMLGEVITMENVQLRIHPGALTENIFRDKNQKAYPKSQEKMRHRGLSDQSTMTHRTNRSEDFSSREWVNTQKPYREPQDPPKSAFAQEHEGFKRFLKQVASPPHNRVTAGGRIVPAGQPFPPPMLKYGSIGTTISQPTPKTLSSVNDGTKPNARVGGTGAQSSSYIPPNQYKVNQNTNPSGLHQLDAARFQGSDNINRVGFEGNVFMGPALQLPQGVDPMYWPSGGGETVFLNGVQYRVIGNAPRLYLEPLQANWQPIPFSTLTPEHVAAMRAQVTQGPYYPAASETQMSLTNATSLYDSSHLLPLNRSSRKSWKKEQEDLRAQLTELDQHLALHHNRLSVFEHSTLAARRKQLVENLDSLRLKIKNQRTTSSPAPVVGQHPAIGTQQHQHPENAENLPSVAALNSASSSETQHSMENLINNNRGVVQVTSVNKKPLASSTCLSPNAPPFIPSNAKTGFDNASFGNSWGASSQSKYSFGSLGFQDNCRVSSRGQEPDISNAVQAMYVTSQKEGPPPSGTTLRSEEAPQEALPVVSPEEVEYADRLCLNSGRAEKLYCSTVAEFQEVIRRVREQARLYGCKGGQSKDPAFDAEQDIRWVMTDQAPIPLPRSTPDHVAKPRPWSFDDSVFNVNCYNTSSGANINGHSSSTYIGSSSQDKSSGSDMLDDPFRIVTHADADGKSWSSADQDVKFEAKDAKPNAVTLLSTPKVKGPSMRDVLNGSTLRTPPKSGKGKNPSPQIPRRPYQAYVEDSGGTPTSGRTQVTCKAFPASVNVNVNKAEEPSEPPSTVYNGSFDPTKPRDDLRNPVWDWGTGQLISVNGQPTGHADPVLHPHVFPGYHQRILENMMTGMKDPTKREGNNKDDSWAPITDSKSRWGPEDDRESLDAMGGPKSCDWQSASVPKVKIPFAPPMPKPAGYIPPELRKSYRSTKPKNPANLCSSNNFLRGILKSPQYTSPSIGHSIPSGAEMRLRAKHEAELAKHAAKHAANKENLKAEAQRALEWATAHGPSPSNPSVTSHNVRKHKASSSLASSNLQVHGVMNYPRVNDGRLDFSSYQSGGGYAPQYSGMEYRSQVPGTPRHDRSSGYYFTTEVGQNNNDPSYSSRSGIPQYDGVWDDMEELIDLNFQGSNVQTTTSSGTTSGGTSKQAAGASDSKRLTTHDFYTNNRRFPPGYEASIALFFKRIREKEDQAKKQKANSTSS